jgi:hypothetical protein
MLEEKELKAILDKDVIDFDDVLLLTHHLDCIKKMQEEYVDLPYDVVQTTNVDCQRIAKRCELFLASNEVNKINRCIDCLDPGERKGKERKLGFYGTPTQVVLYGAN